MPEPLKIAEQAPLTEYTYSPNPAVENAITAVREKHEPMLPAGLSRFQNFLENLGNPHLHLQPVFHVAGTNGKGSSLAFIQAILESAGLTVHKFISPHLVRFEERIVIGGKEISDDLLLSLIDECEAAGGDEPVSFFEFFTALTFLAFQRHKADAVLLETGLGGTYDATNVVEKSISLLTRISFDHMRLLGATLPLIAENKAGIIKQNCPVIVAPQTDNDVLKIFETRAAALHAPMFLANREWSVEEDDKGFIYRARGMEFSLPLPRLLGSHQVVNAGTAIAAIAQSPFMTCLSEPVLTKAMNSVRWQGRLQRLESGALAKLLPSGWELWVDGAHNDSGAEVLMAQVKAWGADKPPHIITGYKRRKEPDNFYEKLAGIPVTIQAVDANIDAPMLSADELCNYLKGAGFADARPAPNLESAIRALTFQFKAPQRIIITGSLYLVGHALKINEAA